MLDLSTVRSLPRGFPGLLPAIVLLSALALATGCGGCGKDEPEGRGARIDTSAGQPRTVSPDRPVATEPGPPVAIVSGPEAGTEEAERALEAALPQAEPILAGVREAASGVTGLSLLRVRATSEAEVLVGYGLAAATLAVEEVVGGTAAEGTIRLLQPAPDDILYLHSTFLPTPGSEYLIAVRPSPAEAGSYELFTTPTFPGYAYLAFDGAYRIDVASGPVVTADQLLGALYP